MKGERKSWDRLLEEVQALRRRLAKYDSRSDVPATALEAERRFQEIFDASFQFMGVLSPDGTLLEANRAALESGGLTREDVVGKPFWEARWWTISPETQAQLKAAIAEAAQGRFVRYEVEVLGAKGAVVIDFSLRPVRDASGVVVRLIPEGRDITARKEVESLQGLLLRQAEGLLRQAEAAEARFRGLLDAAPDGIVISDADGRIVLVNRQTEALFGYRREELLGQPIELLVPERHRPLHVRQRSGYIESPRVRPMGEGMALAARRKDGSELAVEISLSPIQFEGQLLVISVVRDVTSQRVAREQMEAYQQRLRSLALQLTLSEQHERRQIATSLHDDLGQTLVVLKMKLAMLKPGDETKRAAAVKQMDELLNHAIEYTRSLTFELAPPILYDVGLPAALQWLGGQMQQRYNLAVQVQDDGQDKPMPEEIRVLLFQAVRELLVNVGKHAKATQATVALHRCDEAVQVVVKDNGVGFDPAQMQPQVGTGGFGLFNLRERLDSLRGSMVIESAAGQGTTATLRAPLSWA